MTPDAKGDDELVRGNGPKHGPDIGGGLLKADGEPLKHCVEGESQHSEEVSEARQGCFIYSSKPHNTQFPITLIVMMSVLSVDNAMHCNGGGDE